MDKIVLHTLMSILEDSGFKSTYDYLQYGFVFESDIPELEAITSYSGPTLLWVRYRNLDTDSPGIGFEFVLNDLKLNDLYWRISCMQEAFLKDNPIPEEDDIDNIWED